MCGPGVSDDDGYADVPYYNTHGPRGTSGWRLILDEFLTHDPAMMADGKSLRKTIYMYRGSIDPDDTEWVLESVCSFAEWMDTNYESGNVDDHDTLRICQEFPEDVLLNGGTSGYVKLVFLDMVGNICSTCNGVGEVEIVNKRGEVETDPCPDCQQNGKCPFCASTFAEEDMLYSHYDGVSGLCPNCYHDYGSCNWPPYSRQWYAYRKEESGGDICWDDPIFQQV